MLPPEVALTVDDTIAYLGLARFTPTLIHSAF
jgi:hypothetical protein